MTAELIETVKAKIAKVITPLEMAAKNVINIATQVSDYS